MSDTTEPDDGQDRGPLGQRFFGVYVGVVLDNQDPLQLGRVLVRVPSVGGAQSRGTWARVSVPRAGAQRGSVEITGPHIVKLMASTAELTAASLDLQCAMTRTSSVVQCETLIATNVVAQNYMPGAGNIW
jgi:hypothetical protein